MKRFTLASLLILLAALAAAQITLLVRAGQMPFAIVSGLSWLAGGALLVDHLHEHEAESPRALGYPLVGWSLLVLSFAARLYDPMLHGVPFAALVGVGLLGGLSLFSPLLAQLAVIGLLVPAQVLINRFFPTGPLADATAQVSSVLLTLLGRPAVAEGSRILMLERVMHVDASCTGIHTLSLCAAASLILLILLPPPLPNQKLRSRLRWVMPGFLLSAAILTAFLVNAVRITLLGLSRTEPAPIGWGVLSSFDFWHDGTGSHLFSVLAMGLVCLLYVAFLELLLRAAPRGRTLPP